MRTDSPARATRLLARRHLQPRQYSRWRRATAQLPRLHAGNLFQRSTSSRRAFIPNGELLPEKIDAHCRSTSGSSAPRAGSIFRFSASGAGGIGFNEPGSPLQPHALVTSAGHALTRRPAFGEECPCQATMGVSTFSTPSVFIWRWRAPRASCKGGGNPPTGHHRELSAGP